MQNDNMRFKRIILASGSPRRRELLAKMGYIFDTCSPDVDENVQGHASEVVKVLAERKARAAAQMYDKGIIIASDTLVSLDGKGLGKPMSPADAVDMLSLLSGREHDVFTGVCLLDAETGRLVSEVDRTGVSFRVLVAKEIDDYVKTGEPMDKAGAYAIQGGAGVFVDGLDGSFENVMGFPVALVEQMLSDFVK